MSVAEKVNCTNLLSICEICRSRATTNTNAPFITLITSKPFLSFTKCFHTRSIVWLTDEIVKSPRLTDTECDTREIGLTENYSLLPKVIWIITCWCWAYGNDSRCILYIYMSIEICYFNGSTSCFLSRIVFRWIEQKMIIMHQHAPVILFTFA